MVAFLFAGQGSQYIGMGKDLYEAFPQSKAIFDRADKALGFSLSNLCFSGAPETLKQTIFAQPAILTVSIAAYEAFKANNSIEPKFLAGLSLGEYSALIAAGFFSFEDGLKLVRRRAEIMEAQAAKYPGTMAAVLDLSIDEIKKVCLKSGAEIANLNAPGQIVISGTKDSVLKAKDLSLEAGAKRVIELEVSGGFHSSLMTEAAVELKAVIARTPMLASQVPVVSNYTAMPSYKVPQIEENLVCQMYSSVKWEESMKFILSQGVNKFFEFGPGKVLKGLMRRIAPEAEVISIEKKEDLLRLAEDKHAS